MGTPASAIRFDTYGSYQEETFVEQEVYRTITAGVSPYLSSVRGIGLKAVRGGGDYDGEYMAPEDMDLQADYKEANIEPFLSQLKNGPNAQAVEQSASTNNSLKTALDQGNITLAEELAMKIEGSHPTQSGISAPTAAELQLDFMGADLADRLEGIAAPTVIENVVSLSHGGRTAQPADIIANSEAHRAIIKVFTEVVKGDLSEAELALWKGKLNNVKFMDVTESDKKKWIANQIKAGVTYNKKYRNEDGTIDEEKMAGVIKSWKQNFESTMQQLNSHLADIATGFKTLKAAGDYSSAETDKIIADLNRMYGAAGVQGGGAGSAQNGPFVANHMLNVWNLAFQEYVAGGYDEMPSFLEQQPLGDTGWWVAILGTPIITPNGDIGFDWSASFHDSGQAGVASDGVIVAEYAATTAHGGNLSAQEFYDLTRSMALDEWVKSEARMGAHELWVHGMVDQITQPELNIELIPPAEKKGFVGPITQIAGADIAKSLLEQIKLQAKDPSYTGPHADLFNKMLEVANNATKAWKLSAGVQGGELFGEILNDYSTGGIWPDDDRTWNDGDGRSGKDLGVSPFLLGTKEYVKLFGAAKPQYNITLNPAKAAQVREGVDRRGMKIDQAGYKRDQKGEPKWRSLKRPVMKLGKRGKSLRTQYGKKGEFSSKYNSWLRSQG
tara:strand:- start:3409 stop:5415 length:2007 start_codon:yes stop_codon:yes gene_type:complete